MQRSRPKSDYAGQSPLASAKRREGSRKLLGRKNSFSGRTSAQFVRPAPHTVGFAACRAATRGKPQGPSVALPERSAWLQTCSLPGTVRELRTANFKQVQPRPVRARRLKPLKAAPGAS